MSPAAHTPKVLDIIRTAAADCLAQNNTMAQHELLDAAVMARRLLDSLEQAREFTLLVERNLRGDLPNGIEPVSDSQLIEAMYSLRAAIAKATGSAK